MIITKQSPWFKIAVLTTITAVIGISSWYLYHTFAPQEQILDFNDGRDTQDILDIFKRDWYWLIASEQYSVEFMLKYRAPTQDFSRIGQLRIKVLRNKKELIGFVAYYMKTPLEGFLLFLDINPPFRGKGYSDKLLQYALEQLTNMGARTIRLVTRTTNFSAQKLYRRNNFQESHREDGFVYFEKQFK